MPQACPIRAKCGCSVFLLGSYADYQSAYSKGSIVCSLYFWLFSGWYLRCYFFTPVYSSTVLDDMVVVVFVLSPTCVYVAVVEIVLHALQELIPAQTATLISTADTNTSFFIVSFVFG